MTKVGATARVIVPDVLIDEAPYSFLVIPLLKQDEGLLYTRIGS